MRTQSLLLGCVLALGLLLAGWALGLVRLDPPTPAPSDGVRPGLLGDPTPVPPATSPGATVVPTQPLLCHEAQLEGTLAFDEHAGLGIDSGGRVIAVEWPPTWSTRLEPGGVALLDATGSVLARTGDRIRVGGGFGGSTPFVVCPWRLLPPTPPG